MRIERFKDIEEWQLVRVRARKVSEISLTHRFRRLQDYFHHFNYRVYKAFSPNKVVDISDLDKYGE